MSQETKLMPIESEIERELFRHIKNSLNKETLYIRNPLPRLGSLFNFYPEQYMLIGSITGTGKTSYVDHNILDILDYIYDHGMTDNVHVEFLYYSMERKKKIKYAKFISWKMFKEEKLRIPADDILNRKNKLTEGQLKYIMDTYTPWLDYITSYIDMREGPRSVDQIVKDIEEKARKLGSFYNSDSDHVYKFGDYVASFSPDIFVTTKYGRKKYMELVINKQKYVIYENDKLFITKKPTLFFIIIDHVGKVSSHSGDTKKQTLDWLDSVLCDARDNYLMSPIAISQFNRAVSATDRLKYNQGDLDPVLEDFKDTGNMTESADLVLSVFEPSRYKSWNAAGEYKGYNIRDSMVTPDGKQRARSIHILKNSLGNGGGVQLLRFTGESMYFEAMPLPENETELKKIYNEILQGK